MSGVEKCSYCFFSGALVCSPAKARILAKKIKRDTNMHVYCCPLTPTDNSDAMADDFGYDDPRDMSDDDGGTDPPGGQALPPAPSLVDRLQHLPVDESGYQLLSDDDGAPSEFEGLPAEGDELDIEWEGLSDGVSGELSSTTTSGDDYRTSPESFGAAQAEKRIEGLHVGLGGKTLEGEVLHVQYKGEQVRLLSVRKPLRTATVSLRAQVSSL